MFQEEAKEVGWLASNRGRQWAGSLVDRVRMDVYEWSTLGINENMKGINRERILHIREQL